MSKTTKESYAENLIRTAAVSVIACAVAYTWFPAIMPFSMLALWTTKGSLGAWFGAYWWIFLWGAVASTYSAYRKVSRQGSNLEGGLGGNLFGGLFISLYAGVSEEILFRWICFLGAVPLVMFSNWLLLGFAGINIIAWIYTAVLVPVANFTTFGMLAPFFYHPAGWQVGAAILSSNALFRSGHEYQGIVGMVNSWFLGMIFFSLAFQFGLIPAIIVHAAYDVVVIGAAIIIHRLLRVLNYSGKLG